MSTAIKITSNTKLSYPRAELEDDIDDTFVKVLEVTAGSMTSSGWVIELDYLGDEESLEKTLDRLAKFLRSQMVPKDTLILRVGSDSGANRTVFDE
jgi:hypothetical protein